MRAKLLAVLSVFCLVAAMSPAVADHTRDESRQRLKPIGHARDLRTFVDFDFWTDLALWRNKAYQGKWNGFRIVNVKQPERPRVLAEVTCGAEQGDVSVWRTLLIRSVDSPHQGTECDAPPSEGAAGGFEGLEIFDVSDPATVTAGDLIATVATDCGSHTHTLVPDIKNSRLLVYVSNSGGAAYPATAFGNECAGVGSHGKFVIVEIPLADPTSASVIGDATLGPEGAPVSDTCHDIGVYVEQELAVCAGTPLATIHDISNPAQPVFLRSMTAPNVTGWHSGAFSWDGDIAVLGWEPGGGIDAECATADEEFKKSIYFFDVATGELLGTHVLPRDQDDGQNCTIHNYNVVPIKGRNILVHGSYMSGTAVVDFTDPANAREIAFTDPPPLDPAVHPFAAGGAWGSYWYNGLIYETEITEGLNIFKLRKARKIIRNSARMRFLNPQTQMGFSDL